MSESLLPPLRVLGGKGLSGVSISGHQRHYGAPSRDQRPHIHPHTISSRIRTSTYKFLDNTKHSDHSKRSNLSERCFEFACWNLTSHPHVSRETQSCLSESSLGLQDEVKNSAADFALVQLTGVDSCPILDPRSPKVEFTQPAYWEVPSSEPLPLRHQLNIHSITSAGLQKP